MSEKTNIAWCDSTINFWSGCTKISDGCKNCYAEARDARMLTEKIIHWGKGAPRLKSKGAVETALAMNRKPWICDQCGYAFASQMGGHFAKGGKKCYPLNEDSPLTYHRRKIFSLSLGDWLDEEAPVEWLVEMLETIFKCQEVIWILCTKRPENFWGHESEPYLQGRLEAVQNAVQDSEFKRWLCLWGNGRPPKNVWILTSVENQDNEQRIRDVLRIPAIIHGLSVEPMLGPINFDSHFYSSGDDGESAPRNGATINWCIFGGESGNNARPCNVDWIRDGVKQCRAAGIKVFVKQMGSNAVMRDGCFVSEFSDSVAKAIAEQPATQCKFADKKGGDMSEWPADLRVRQFPNV